MAKALENAINSLDTTPQTQKAAKGQKKNNAGGFSFVVSPVQRLTRFLVLGTEGGTYYTSERDLTKQNVDFIVKMIKSDESVVLDTLTEISVEARAPKNDYALFVLALVFKYGKDKAAARAALPKVARTATHLFQFVAYLKAAGAFSTSAQKAVAAWYTEKPVPALATQVVKYRNRAGYTHRDVLRLTHPKGLDTRIGNFVLGKPVGETSEPLPALEGFEKAQAATTTRQAVKVIKDYPFLPWEVFPTAFHKEADFWKTLFETGNMGQTALLRNVTRFAKLGLFSDLVFAKTVADVLSDPEKIKSGRLHPVNYLNALFIYKNGAYQKGASAYGYSFRQKDWTVTPKVASALEKGFYEAFVNVEPSGKRTMLSLDVSGSMSSAAAGGLAGLDCRQASAAMALVTLRTEDYVTINGFTSGRPLTRGERWNFSSRNAITDLPISQEDTIASAIKAVSDLPFGRTDCSLPMLRALELGQEIDTFVIYTDSETWAGNVHPHEALAKYRKATGIPAKLVVVGMVGNPFTIAKPDDAGMLDVVGFDSAAPKVIADFSAGRI